MRILEPYNIAYIYECLKFLEHFEKSLEMEENIEGINGARKNKIKNL